jgi:biopolymer transport protein ExbB
VTNKRIVVNPIKTLLKYQEVKREGLDSEAAAETIHKEIEEVN